MGTAGAWHELGPDRLCSTVRACACCGRPLFGSVWRAEAGGETRDFCEPRCETLFTGYWLPRHGSPTRTEA
jgi:hypothetical protein